jgi:hypothetical protein
MGRIHAGVGHAAGRRAERGRRGTRETVERTEKERQ